MSVIIFDGRCTCPISGGPSGGVFSLMFHRGESICQMRSTGNIDINLSQNVFACNWELTIRYHWFPVLLFFAFGVAVATWIRQSISKC